MLLNSLSPSKGSKSKRKRVGRGQGSGLGKTCGRGDKGQKSRSGGFHKIGFEGGQMPLQMRLPKIGFKSRKKLTHQEVALENLNKFENNATINLDALKEKNLVRKDTKTAKVMLSGEINKAINLSGIKVSKGAKAAIEKAGGKVI